MKELLFTILNFVDSLHKKGEFNKFSSIWKGIGYAIS